MFSELYQLVKLNSLTIVTENNIVPLKFKDAVLNEASGTIIDVLKTQLENGKFKDLFRLFQNSEIENSFIIKAISNKYAIRLNKYYSINMPEAKSIANKLIPDVMKNFISVIKHAPAKEQDMFSFLNWLSGNTINFEALFLKTNSGQLA